MHLCFVDESGTPPSAPSRKNPYFTLGAVIIEDRRWKDVANDVRGFCTSHGIRGEMKWRYFAPDNSSADSPILHLSRQERRELRRSFASAISQMPLTIISCVTDVEVAFEYGAVTNQRELYHFCYKPLTERFQYFLQDVDSLGIIVADHRGRDDDRLFRAHHETLTTRRAQTRSAYDRFIEGLLLQDSCHSIGIQLADFVAGAVHRAYARGDSETAALLKPRFRAQGEKIRGYGLVHHPKDRFRADLCEGGRRAEP